MTANIISAGKSLIDYLQACSKGDGTFLAFDKLRTSKYSEREAYCLLYELRNYAQHGQLIVATYYYNDKVRACFDLFQLKEPLFYTPSKKVESLLNAGIELIESIDGSPKLSFGSYMDQCNSDIRELYLEFLKCFKTKANQATKELFSFLCKNRHFLISLPSGGKGLFYKQDDKLHLIEGLEEKLTEVPYRICFNEAKMHCKQAKKAFEKRRKNLIKIVFEK